MLAETLSALIGGVSGIVCAVLTARTTSGAARKHVQSVDAIAAAFLTSQIAPALRSYASGCLSVSYDDGYEEGRPAGENGLAQATVSSPLFKPSDFNVEWKALPSSLMVDLLTFPEHAQTAASVLDNEYGDYNPPDFAEYFFKRQQIYSGLGIAALALAERLYVHVALGVHQQGKELRERLAARLIELAKQGA